MASRGEEAHPTGAIRGSPPHKKIRGAAVKGAAASASSSPGGGEGAPEEGGGLVAAHRGGTRGPLGAGWRRRAGKERGRKAGGRACLLVLPLLGAAWASPFLPFAGAEMLHLPPGAGRR